MVHTATLHKPHVGSHDRQSFVDTNISGTLNLLEAAVEFEVAAFVFTSTTSTFRARPYPGSGRTGGLDHRGRTGRSEKHIRRHENGR